MINQMSKEFVIMIKIVSIDKNIQKTINTVRLMVSELLLKELTVDNVCIGYKVDVFDGNPVIFS